MTTQNHLDAFALAQALRERLTRYSLDTFYFQDQEFRGAAEEVWSDTTGEDGLIGKLWAEGGFPPESSGETLLDLSQRRSFPGELARHLNRPGVFPANQELYSLQRDAVEADFVAPGEREPAILVAAATGAGKTEAFLLPMLSRMWKQESRGAGTRCFILYPMNALIRDQVDRLEKWLEGQSKLRFFSFNSETPETRANADREGIPRTGPHRIRTRREARERPPEVCVTNYSMLEYMLARPQDAPFFGPALEMVVIDEAHLYRGALAAEIALLLRRLLIRCGRHPDEVLFIGTSATLGGEESEQRRFFAKLTGKRDDDTRLILGKPAPLESLPRPTIDVSPEDVDRDDVVEHDWKELVNWRPLARIREQIWEAGTRPLSIDKLAGIAWNRDDSTSHRAVMRLMRWSAGARESVDTTPLIPHRLHLPVRGSPGLSLCISRVCRGPLERKVHGYGCLQSTRSERCRWCEALAPPVVRCDECGSVYLAVERHQLRVEIPHLEPHSRSLPESVNCLIELSPAGHIGINIKTGGITIADENDDTAPATLYEYEDVRKQCPHCRDRSRDATEDSLHSCIDDSRLIPTLIAETMVSHLPPMPPIVGNGGTSRPHPDILPAKGRRLLVFSDSRREAARLGPVLTAQHEIQVVRAALLDAVENAPQTDQENIDSLQRELDRKREEVGGSSSPAMKARLKRDIEGLEADIAEGEAGGSLKDWIARVRDLDAVGQLLDRGGAREHQSKDWNASVWTTNRTNVERDLPRMIGREFLGPGGRQPNLETLGLISVVYPGIDTLEVPPEFAMGLPENVLAQLSQNWPKVVAALLDSLRASDAVTLGSPEEDADAFDGPRPIGKFAVERGRGDRTTEPFVGATERQARRRFARDLLVGAGLSSLESVDNAPNLLGAVFRQLLRGAQENTGNGWSWLQGESHTSIEGLAQDSIRVYIPGLALRRPDKVWLERETGRIVTQAPFSRHPQSRYEFEEIRVGDLDSDPRFARRRDELRNNEAFRLGLWAEEHTAQLSPVETRRLQDLFEIGVRNVLSSSTTMELGVDIGGLEGILMSNAPPNHARYRQRAGRAGRRGSGSAIAISYTRHRPFDREVFSRFDDYLRNPLPPPSVILSRVRIAKRHLHAHLLGSFMQLVQPGNVTGAMQAYGRMGPFTAQPSVPYWDTSEKPHGPSDPSSGALRSDVTERPWWDATTKKAVSDRFVDYLSWLGSAYADPMAEQLRNLSKGTGAEAPTADLVGFCEEVALAFKRSVDNWRNEYEYYLQAWEQAHVRREANFIRYQAIQLYETTVIEHLANQQFLPRYGFPIGLLGLKVMHSDPTSQRVRPDDRYELRRAGTLAMREYAPGAHLIVGGLEFESRGILKHWTGSQIDTAIGARRVLLQCVNGHDYVLPVPQPQDTTCHHCGAVSATPERTLLHVRFGFSTAAWQTPRRARAADPVGEADLLTQSIDQQEIGGDKERSMGSFAGVPGFYGRETTGVHLLATNTGDEHHGFAVCLGCGYAESETHESGDGRINLPAQFESHRPLYASAQRQRACWQDPEAQVLRHQILAAEEVTDTLILDFAEADSALATDQEALTAIGLAAQHAGGKLLLIDPHEIGFKLQPTGAQSSRLFFYDNVPGGAGHMGDLYDAGREWLKMTLDRLFVDDRHHDVCTNGCLDCVISFEGQYQLPEKLDRRGAWEKLRKALDVDSRCLS